MAMIPAAREQYVPENDLQTPGQYYAQCSRVEQGIPYPEFPNKTRIAIEFTIKDKRYPALVGKKAAIVCPESLGTNTRTRQPSYLAQYAKQMGVKNPEKGFDPDQFIGKWFYITADAGDGRCNVHAAIPMDSPDAAAQGGQMQPPTNAGERIAQDERMPF